MQDDGTATEPSTSASMVTPKGHDGAGGACDELAVLARDIAHVVADRAAAMYGSSICPQLRLPDRAQEGGLQIDTREGLARIRESRVRCANRGIG
jgi:hypothetical protein